MIRCLPSRAMRQARGDMIEAIFLVRAYRTTLPRFGYSEPIDTSRHGDRSDAFRRPSRICRAGRFLGRHSTTRTDWLNSARAICRCRNSVQTSSPSMRRTSCSCSITMGSLSVLRPAADEAPVGDITRQPLTFPAARDVRLQNLARGDEGFSAGTRVIRRSVVTGARTRLSARFATAKSSLNSTPRIWALRCRSARSR